MSTFKVPLLVSFFLCSSTLISACKQDGNSTEKNGNLPKTQSGNHTPQPAPGNTLSPTGLTLVCCDSGNRVIDTVVVVDNGQSGRIEFRIPAEANEIRVFAIGDRIDDFFKSEGTFTNSLLIGRPAGQPDGFGFIEATLDSGLLSGIAPGNSGRIPLDLNDSLRKQIAADIAADQRAETTKVIFRD